MSKPFLLSAERQEANGPAEQYEKEKVPGFLEPAARFFLEHVALQPHDRVLDIACGTGIVARLVAEQVSHDGSITGLDINPSMLAVARTAASQSDLRIDWREGDALDLPFDAESFDLVMCQQGIQYFPDKEASLRGMFRVLVPDGRVAILVAASITFEDQPRKWAEMEALRKHVSMERSEKERHPGYFQGGVNTLKKLVGDAKFRNVDVNQSVVHLGPRGTLEQLIPEEKYSDLEPKTRMIVVKDIREAMRPYDKGTETQLPVGFYIAIAHK